MKNNMIKTLAMRAKNRLMNREGINAKITIIKDSDEGFVEKVRAMLENEEWNSSPLKTLMDERQMKRLDERGREKYLLDTMDKYLKVKEQIESEKLRNIAF